MIFVFLPAYNEEAALEKLADKFRAAFRSMGEPYRIIVLDDGSSDATAAKARALAGEHPLELLRHEVNQGLGQTMIDGLAHVAKSASDEDVLVTMDCDDTHDPSYVPQAIKKLSEGYDVVILSRYEKGGGEEGLSFIRSFLSRGAGIFLKIFFPIRGVQEYSCGYRVMRTSTLRQAFANFGDQFIRLPHLGFVVTPEILIKLRMMGARIAEIPFTLHYEQKSGVSKNKPFRTILGYFALLRLYWLRKPPVRPGSASR